MEKLTRRNVLKDAAKVAAVTAGGAAMAGRAAAQSAAKVERRNAKAKPGDPKPAKKPIYTDVVGLGNLLFVAGKAQHGGTTIEEQTNWVLDLMETNLKASGSSMQKVLKVNVYLKNLEQDLDKMNATYSQRDWGEFPPARTTTSSPGGFPGGPECLITVDMIAYA